MHKHMALSIDECVEYTHLKEKTTAIIPTRSSSINFLLWSVFSLLLRSKPNGMLEHFCVCINGADERTGDISLEDKKQDFLEELRDIEWYHANDPDNKRGMPLTVIRVWSRVGYAEVFEMAINWTHTDSYTLIHDDVIIKNPNWDKEVKEKFYDNEKVAIAHVGPLLGCPCDYAVHKGMYLLRLPQMETTFLVCKKKWLMKVGSSCWHGFHIPNDDNILQFDLDEIGSIEEFEQFWKDRDLYPESILKTELYNFVRQEVGAWVYYNLFKNGYEFSKLNDDNIIHFGEMSRADRTEEVRQQRIEECGEDIEKLESEILQHPEYSKLYLKYKE